MQGFWKVRRLQELFAALTLRRDLGPANLEAEAFQPDFELETLSLDFLGTGGLEIKGAR